MFKYITYADTRDLAAENQKSLLASLHRGLATTPRAPHRTQQRVVPVEMKKTPVRTTWRGLSSLPMLPREEKNPIDCRRE